MGRLRHGGPTATCDYVLTKELSNGSIFYYYLTSAYMSLVCHVDFGNKLDKSMDSGLAFLFDRIWFHITAASGRGLCGALERLMEFSTVIG